MFEHPECGVASNGYLGEDGFVERNRFGSLRCHLCGRYQQKLDLHIVEEHNFSVEEYKKLFSLSDDEILESYIVEHDVAIPNPLSSDKDPPQILVFNHSVTRMENSMKSGTRIKRENPLNKKRKRGKKQN